MENFTTTSKIPSQRDMRAKFTGHFYVLAGLDASIVLGSLNAKIVGARIGPKQPFDLGFEDDQAARPDHPASYALTRDSVVEPGAALKDAIRQVIADDSTSAQATFPASTKPRFARLCALTLAAALLLPPAPSQAIAPLLLVMLKQLAQDAAKSMLKDMLLSQLNGMGCKGMALAHALQGMTLRGALSGAAGSVLPPMGMGVPMGMGIGNGMPAGLPPEMAAKMGELIPGMGQMPTGMALDADQMAAMARMQQAMSKPLSPRETLASIDALTELGFLPKPIQAELKECMLLIPAAVQALGMGMGMLQPMIPQLRQARAELHALPVAEQDEVAAALAQDLQSFSADERKALADFLDSGFFPKRVADGVKARLSAK